MDDLTLFGAASVGAMLTFYALEGRSPRFLLAFAAACLSSSLYGFLAGTWPFGVIELVWSVVALQRWLGRAHGVRPPNLRLRLRWPVRRVRRRPGRSRE